MAEEIWTARKLLALIKKKRKGLSLDEEDIFADLLFKYAKRPEQWIPVGVLGDEVFYATCPDAYPLKKAIAVTEAMIKQVLKVRNSKRSRKEEKERNDLVRKLKAEGKSYKQVSIKTGLTEAQVKGIIRRQKQKERMSYRHTTNKTPSRAK